MGPIKEAFTFDDVTLAPSYSEIMPSDVITKTVLSKYDKSIVEYDQSILNDLKHNA